VIVNYVSVSNKKEEVQSKSNENPVKKGKNTVANAQYET